MKLGFVISQSKSAKKYFTATSSYDKPIYTTLAEATVYQTAELAQSALSKLWKYHNFSASMISLKEFEEDPKPSTMPIDQEEQFDDTQIEDPEDEMKAGTLDDDNDEIELSDDNLQHDESDEDVEDNENAISQTELDMNSGKIPNTGNGPIVGESEAITANLLPKTPIIKFNQSFNDQDEYNYSKDIKPLYDGVKTPARIITAINDAIKEFDDVSKYNNGKDDAQSSIALTISGALQDLLQDLSLGTAEGLKAAQIRITSYMNPISSNLPPCLFDYLSKAGRQPSSLKNVFYDKWDK